MTDQHGPVASHGYLWVAPAKPPRHWTPQAVWMRLAWRLWRHRQWTCVGVVNDPLKINPSTERRTP